MPSTIAGPRGRPPTPLRLVPYSILRNYVDFHLSDGTSIRKRVSKKLVKEQKGLYEFERHRGSGIKSPPALKTKRQEFMQQINAGQNESMHLDREMLITDFW